MFSQFPRNEPAPSLPPRPLDKKIDLSHRFSSREFAESLLELLNIMDLNTKAEPTAKIPITIERDSLDILKAFNLIERAKLDEKAFFYHVPYFVSDSDLHEDGVKVADAMKRAKDSIDQGNHNSLSVNGMLVKVFHSSDYVQEYLTHESNLHSIRQCLADRAKQNTDSNIGPIRLTNIAKGLKANLDSLTQDDRFYYLRILGLKAELDPGPLVFESLRSHMKKLVDLDPTGQHLRKFYLYVTEIPAKTFQRLMTGTLEDRYKDARFCKEINLYIEAQSASNINEAKRAMKVLHSEAKYGDLPFSPDDPRRKEAQTQSFSVVRRGRGHSYTVPGQLAVDMRRSRKDLDCLIVQFGKECCDVVQRVHGSTIEDFPGPGYYLEGIKLEKLFHQEKAIDYGLAFKWGSKEIADLANASFIFTRGLIILSNNDKKFGIEGNQYSYVIINNHFSGTYIGAMLIPTRVIAETFGPSFCSLNNSENLQSRDICSPEARAKFSEIIDRCEQLRLAPLNLTSLATLFAGCCAAYPVGWAPHYDWELDPHYQAFDYRWRDYTRRIHLGALTAGLNANDEDYKQTLSYYQVLHYNNHRVTKAYQNLMDIFLHRYGAWKSDLTPGEISMPTVLGEAKRWHDAGHAAGWTREKFHKICLVKTGNTSSRMRIAVDTYDLTVNKELTDGQQVSLSSPSSATNLTLWKRYIVPQLVDQNGRETGWHLSILANEYIKT